MSWFNPKWYKPLGQTLELASVFLLVAILGVAWSPLSTVWKVIIALAAVAMAGLIFWAAVNCLALAIENSKAEAEESESKAKSNKHVISDARLLVLKEEKIPRDAFEVLRELIHSQVSFDHTISPLIGKFPSGSLNSTEKTAAELIAELRKVLGRARTEEVKDLVLKYTLKDEDEDLPKQSENKDSPTSAQSSEPTVAI